MRNALVLLVAALALALVPPPSVLAAPAAPAACRFVLGFKVIHDLIPATVGSCVTDEYHNPLNGDGLQETTGGLLVWRKADNWTAFTNGSRTWVNGPYGLQQRSNDERFPWEAQEGRPVQVTVYFSRDPQSLQDFSAVFPRVRTVTPEGQRVASAALDALIAGPTAAEAAQGYFSELGGMLGGPSTCSGEDFILTIDAGTATLRFCRQVSSAGIGQDARVQSAIEATLLEFPSIQRVRVLRSDGGCLFDQSGLDLCLN
jgi:hypothetical protein